MLKKIKTNSNYDNDLNCVIIMIHPYQMSSSRPKFFSVTVTLPSEFSIRIEIERYSLLAAHGADGSWGGERENERELIDVIDAWTPDAPSAISGPLLVPLQFFPFLLKLMPLH